MEQGLIEDIASLNEWFDENEECFIVPYIEQHFKQVSWPYQYDYMKKHLFFTKKIINDFRLSNGQKQDLLLKSLAFGKSKIVLIIGGRGSGKTGTASWIMEILHSKGLHKKIYFVKEGEKPKGMPIWIKHVYDIEDVKNDSIAIIDESAIKYNSRQSWTDENKDFVKRLVILRHKGTSLILITQHSKMLEIGARRLADVKIYKMGADINNPDESIDDEKRLIRNRLMPHSVDMCLIEIPLINDFYQFKHDLPKWFDDNISKSFADFNPEERTKKAKAEKLAIIREKYQMQKELELAKIDRMKELNIEQTKEKRKIDKLEI